MEKVLVKADSKNYYIHFCTEPDEISGLIAPHLNENSTNFLITDDNVRSIYKSFIEEISTKLSLIVISIPEGESSKSLEMMGNIYDRLIDNGCDRKSTLIGLGGGVVGDITGFAAGTIFRGVPFIQVPTTLLAQSDSSVGGKTGINHPKGKNLIGVFNQPEAVIIDLHFLKTLPKEQFLSGMGEVVKSAIIGDIELFSYLQQNIEEIAPDSILINKEMVHRSILMKKRVVEEDEREKGLRMILNYGHTIGHGVEKYLSEKITHGEAVFLGMYAANQIALEKKIIEQNVFAEINDMLKFFIAKIKPYELDTKKVFDHIVLDKKWFGGKKHFILTNDIAKPIIIDDIEIELIENTIKKLNNVLSSK